jgi:hypothetical protein
MRQIDEGDLSEVDHRGERPDSNDSAAMTTGERAQVIASSITARPRVARRKAVRHG